MNSAIEIRELGLEVLSIVLPCDTIHARCRTSLECKVRPSQKVDINMVEERGDHTRAGT